MAKKVFSRSLGDARYKISLFTEYVVNTVLQQANFQDGGTCNMYNGEDLKMQFNLCFNFQLSVFEKFNL